jgi:hypothetical protein
MSLGAKLFLSEPDMMLFLNRAAGYPVMCRTPTWATGSGFPHPAGLRAQAAAAGVCHL